MKSKQSKMEDGRWKMGVGRAARPSRPHPNVQPRSGQARRLSYRRFDLHDVKYLLNALVILFTVHCSLITCPAAHVEVPVIDSVSGPVTNCQVVLALAGDGATSGTNFVVRKNVTNTTPASGVTIFSNVPAASYTLTIYATARGSVWSIVVPTNEIVTNAIGMVTGTNVTWTTWADALTTTSNSLFNWLTATTNGIQNAMVANTNFVMTNAAGQLTMATNTVMTNAAANLVSGTNIIQTNVIGWLASGTNIVATNANWVMGVSTNFVMTNGAGLLTVATNTVMTNAAGQLTIATNNVLTNLNAQVVSITNGGWTTNLPVIVPGSYTNRILFTNGVMRGTN